jgi:hypothetical protein
MNAKLFIRMLIVVLALLALTTLVAAAQDNPAAPEKALPAVVEIGESGSPAATMIENEPNNYPDEADPVPIGGVVSGKIDAPGDVDYYRIDVPSSGYSNLMFDIDAEMNGSPLDTEICLYRSDLSLIKCNDDSNGHDSLILGSVWHLDGPAYLTVKSYYTEVGGPTYTYKMMVYRALFVSGATGGTVAGIKFQPADVLAHYDFADGTEKWMLLFDASDVGITKNLVALHVGDGALQILFSLAASQTLYMADNGVFGNYTITPYDTVTFDYGSVGPNTWGDFAFKTHFKPEGLTTSGEKIDALAEWFDLSTTGTAKFPNGGVAKDEDIFFTVYGQGIRLFDGSNVPGLSVEDVVGADEVYEEDGYLFYLTILGSGNVDGHAFTQKDIFIVNSVTNDVIAPFPYWHGPDHHFNYNIDALDAVDH